MACGWYFFVVKNNMRSLMVIITLICCDCFQKSLYVNTRQMLTRSVGSTEKSIFDNKRQAYSLFFAKKTNMVQYAVNETCIEVESPEELAGGTNNLRGNTNQRTKKPETLEPYYWTIHSDPFSIERDQTSLSVNQIRFTIRGNPLPLRRHRTARGFMYNPSSVKQMEFRQLVQNMIFEDNEVDEPLFSQSQALAVAIVFCMKRPKSHFIGGKPSPGRLRSTAPAQTSTTRTDVDNLAKFVLDSLNGLLYADDRQVTSLHVVKVLDNRDECSGSTEVLVRPIREDDVPVLINKATDNW